MSAAVVVAVLVAAGEAQSPVTIAIQEAAAEVLGSGGSVLVQEASVFSDGEALRVEAGLHAAAVVEVHWSGAAKAKAHVRIHIARGDRWIDREIAFRAGDLMPERGRTIGFAIASMLLSQAEGQPPPGPPPTAPSTPGPKPAPAPVVAVAERSVGVPERESGGVLADERAATSRTLGVSAVAARGWGGPASGWGLAGHFEASIGRTLWLRAGAGIRTGAVPGLNGSDTVVSAQVGAAWRPYPASSASPLGGGFRLEAGALFHDLSHDTPDGGSTHQGRLMPGTVLAAEGTWRVNRSVDAVIAIASEIAFGVTEVLVAGQPVATIPVLRGLAELGVRIRF